MLFSTERYGISWTEGCKFFRTKRYEVCVEPCKKGRTEILRDGVDTYIFIGTTKIIVSRRIEDQEPNSDFVK